MIALRRTALLGLFSFLTTAMLLESNKALQLSMNGLNLWFQRMIPTLLPFMILSGLLIRLQLSDSFARLFSPILGPLFCLSDSCLYCIVIGFLCGFPMGARTVAESLQQHKINRREASLLLAFCNNIGPIYFAGFVLLLFPVKNPWLCLAGMYLLPLLYGLFLRYAIFRDIPLYERQKAAGQQKAPERQKTAGLQFRKTAKIEKRHPETSKQAGLLEQLQESITSALVAMASLGGYMILFNLLNLIPDLLLPTRWKLARALCACLLEITGGLSLLAPQDALWAFVLLPFGGLSCIAQTYSMIRETELSLGQYTLHKIIQSLLAYCYYSACLGMLF